MPALTKPPFSMVGIDHVVFLVDDLARATRWYAEILGCQRGYSYPKLGMEQLWCGAALIVLWDITHPGAANAVPPVRGGRNVDHVCIALSPFDDGAMRAHLHAHKVEIVHEALHGGARGMGNSFYVLDPWGNSWSSKARPSIPTGGNASRVPPARSAIPCVPRPPRPVAWVRLPAWWKAPFCRALLPPAG